VAQDLGSAGKLDLLCAREGGHVPVLALVGLGELDLDSVDAVYAVDEENQDKDECDLHSILYFCDQGTLATVRL
jgi:hypothetical protein